MKALTVHGVWAWCIMHAGKNVENRSWTPPLKMIGQRIAIHAGQNPGDSYDRDNIRKRYRAPREFPKGAILGSVVLKGFVDVEGDTAVGLTRKELRSIAKSKWAGQGSCWWVIEDPVPAAHPLPCKGALGLWNVPAELAAELERSAPVERALPNEAPERTRQRAKGASPPTSQRPGNGPTRLHGVRIAITDDPYERAILEELAKGEAEEAQASGPGRKASSSDIAPHEIELDGNMRVAEVRGAAYEQAIARLLGSPIADVQARIRSAPRRMKLGNAFHELWPDRHTELGQWSVAFAAERDAEEEIADQFGLSFSVVKKRLAKAAPQTSVRDALRSK